MPSLRELQRRLRNAVVNDVQADVLPLLVGGPHPAGRLAIHRRHYETTLTRRLVERFPALVWLLGGQFFVECARDFVRRPPTTPCIAEYGEEFPAFISARSGAERAPFLRWFGELEWHIGRVVLAVERPCLAMAAFAAVDKESLPDIVLTLQPGLKYFEAPWPVDDLMNLFLTDAVPNQYVVDPARVRLEIRGTRGQFHIDRLDLGTFVLRQAVLEGQSIGTAAEHALRANATFEPGSALTMLIADGLVTGVTLPAGEAAR